MALSSAFCRSSSAVMRFHSNSVITFSNLRSEGEQQEPANKDMIVREAAASTIIARRCESAWLLTNTCSQGCSSHPLSVESIFNAGQYFMPKGVNNLFETVPWE